MRCTNRRWLGHSDSKTALHRKCVAGFEDRFVQSYDFEDFAGKSFADQIGTAAAAADAAVVLGSTAVAVDAVVAEIVVEENRDDDSRKYGVRNILAAFDF